MDHDRPRTALVTGAARGLGLAVAARLLADGYRVAAADLKVDGPELDELRQRFGDDRVLALPCDVTDGSSVDSATAAVIEWAGRLDAVVANAGVLHRVPTEHLTTDDLRRVFDVNVAGAFLCAQSAYPHLRESDDASIVVIGSIGSTLGMPSRAAYNVSKTALLGLTRTIAAEWGPHGVRMNTVAPGFIETVMMRSGLDSGALDEASMLRRIPLRRLGEPDDIAAVVAFLCSPDARYISGALIPVDGGLIIDGTFS